MTTWWFPDNTVLCNFAMVDRLDLLEKALAGRGRWVEAVAHEASQSALRPELRALRAVAAAGWLSDPVEIPQDAAFRVEAIRVGIFGGSRMQPLAHLGEAQTLYLLDNEAEFSGGFWLTDDRAAYDYARRRGIFTRTTVDIVRIAIADCLLATASGFDLLRAMELAGRYVHAAPKRIADL